MAKKKASLVAVPVQPDAYPLLSYLDGIVEDLRGFVPRALRQFDEEAVHQARVGTRRLKAALDLTEPVLGKASRKALPKVLRKLRRTLGPLRDLDVMVARLREPVADDPHADAARWLVERLVARREQARQAARGASTSAILSKLGAWWGVREEIAEARDAAGALVASSVHGQLDEFAADADHLTGVATRFTPTGEPAPAQDPHELRIAGKALRYTLEMADKQNGGLPAGVGKSFKAMQELLGQWHDHVVLSEQALRVSLDEMLAHHDAAMQAKVCDLSKDAAQHAAGQLNEFAELWKRSGAGLTATIRAAFPLTRAVGLVEAPVVETQPLEPAQAQVQEAAPA